MSARSENIKKILSEIGSKFEELFSELKKETTEEDGEINQAYKSFKSKMSEVENDVKFFAEKNQDTIDKIKGKFEEITGDIENAFDKAFNKKDKN